MQKMFGLKEIRGLEHIVAWQEGSLRMGDWVMDATSSSEDTASHCVSAVAPVHLAGWPHSTCWENKFMSWRGVLDSTLVASLILHFTFTHKPQLAFYIPGATLVLLKFCFFIRAATRRGFTGTIHTFSFPFQICSPTNIVFCVLFVNSIKIYSIRNIKFFFLVSVVLVSS